MTRRPILANYYLTYRCNARCRFCDIWERPSPLAAIEDVDRNLRDLKRLGVRIIDFTGGEPLLHGDLATLLGMAKERGFLTTVTTNGLLYPKRAQALAGLVDLLHFSIDSPLAIQHDASRGVACFDHLMASLRSAMQLGERPDLLFTVTESNHQHLERIYEGLARPNRLQLIVNPIFAYGAVGGQLSAPVLARLRAFAKRPGVYLNPAFITLRSRGGNDPARPVCRAVSTSVVISPFNELVLPCYHAGLEKLPINGRLFELWNSERVAYHREMEGRHAVCNGCTINCYFEPSFAVTPTSQYFWESLPSKVRYSWTKFIVQRLARKLGGARQAYIPDWKALESRDADVEVSSQMPLPVLPRPASAQPNGSQ